MVDPEHSCTRLYSLRSPQRQVQMDDAAKLPHKYGRIDKDYAMALATRAPEDDSPIYMVNLMKYHEVAQYTDGEGVGKEISGKEADDRYNPSSVLNTLGSFNNESNQDSYEVPDF